MQGRYKILLYAFIYVNSTAIVSFGVTNYQIVAFIIYQIPTKITTFIYVFIRYNVLWSYFFTETSQKSQHNVECISYVDPRHLSRYSLVRLQTLLQAVSPLIAHTTYRQHETMIYNEIIIIYYIT